MTPEQMKLYLQAHELDLTDKALEVIHRLLRAAQNQVWNDVLFHVWQFREDRMKDYGTPLAAMYHLTQALNQAWRTDHAIEVPRPRKKVVYLAHPILGNVRGNLEDLSRIVRIINLTQPDVVPFVPYYADAASLDDTVPAERLRGMENGQLIMKLGMIDEVWLTGERISAGMKAEQALALQLSIPVLDKRYIFMK